MRFVVCVFALLFVPALVEAQGHPCDVTAPAAVQTKSPPSAFGVCWSQKDEDGAAATATSLKVFIDGTLAKTVPNPIPAGPANSAGLFYYATSGVAVARGARTLTVVIATADGDSDASAAYTFSVVGGKPAKPGGARVEPR